MNHVTKKTKRSKAGMTLIEVLVATVLLIMGLATFLASFSSVQRVSVTTDHRMKAMYRARGILESVMSQPYDSPALHTGSHTLSDASYTVSSASGFVTTKDITVTVPWTNPNGNTTFNLVLRGSMAKCIH